MAACLVVENEAILRISRMMLGKSDHRFLTVQRHAGPPGLPNMAEIPHELFLSERPQAIAASHRLLT